MDSKSPSQLSIGEFSAATQLSPKALRLYDEQQLLRPASIDPGTGYRYYHAQQVAQGRLIRNLRDMDLPLSAIAGVVGAERVRAESLLVQFAQEVDQRYAHQKSAFQRALAQLNRVPTANTAVIESRDRPLTTVVVRPFIANRWTLLSVLRTEAFAARSEMKQPALDALKDVHCVLVDPLSDEDARLELLVPLVGDAAIQAGLTVRQLPATEVATLSISPVSPQLSELTSALDALFDWFDRRGCHVTEPPSLSFEVATPAMRMRISSAYEPVA